MQEDQHEDETRLTRSVTPGSPEKTAITSYTQEGRRSPAKLPAYSQAAAAQRLNDIPERPAPGFYYAASHHPEHPLGWRTKRHGKRKNLRITIGNYIATERTSRRTIINIGLTLICVFVIATIVLTTVTGFVDATTQRYQTQVITLQDILPKDNLKLYAANGQLMYQAIDQGLQTSEPLDKISPNLAHAEIAIEDQNFWQNPGYDITGVIRAAISDLTSNRVVSGGSTITQQLIKNVVINNQSQTVTRKLQEIILAPEVTRYYTKQQILAMYLNTTYYGTQAYGAEAAAFTYFDLKDTASATAAQRLDIAQSATLAGIPSAPTARNPLLNRSASIQRTIEVLQQMYVQKYITAQQKAQAIVEIQQPHFIKPGTIDNRYVPNYVNYTLRELSSDLHVKINELSRTGLIVKTTYDLKLQSTVQQIAKKQVEALEQSKHITDAAVVVIDYHTGDIKTIVGNIDPTNPKYGDFDVATQGYRQPGSSFKPFIYATAFEHGTSPGTPVYDGPLSVPMCCGLPPYTPHNYDLQYHGLITYRYALQNSFNIPAVKLLIQTGVQPSLQTAQAMGIKSYEGIPNYTMVLGSLSIRLIDNTAAYGTFANQGVYIPPHSITSVTDTNGHVIFTPSEKGTHALTKEAAFMITNVLSDNQARTFEFGQCSSLLLFPHTTQQCYEGNPGPVRPSAAKTGTSNDFKDNWTMGYTSDFVVGVWAGNNDNSAMNNVTGVDGAGPIWQQTMLQAELGHPIKPLQSAPSDVIKKTVTYPGITTTDWYLK